MCVDWDDVTIAFSFSLSLSVPSLRLDGIFVGGVKQAGEEGDFGHLSEGGTLATEEDVLDASDGGSLMPRV